MGEWEWLGCSLHSRDFEAMYVDSSQGSSQEQRLWRVLEGEEVLLV
jgi:hypothetical protein